MAAGEVAILWGDHMSNEVSRKLALVHEPGGGRRIRLGLGGTVRLKVEGVHSNGQMVLYEFTMPSRTAGPPMHIHEQWDEAFYVLDGEVSFDIASEVHLVPAGGCVFVAGRTPHTFWNASNRPATNLVVLTPSGLESYFDEVSDAMEAGASEHEIHALIEKHAMEVIDDGRPAYGGLES
jgi:mannose-6-phosphate isomerase-like protein (cupin superfamily)